MYIASAASGAYSSTRFSPRSSTYRLSWWSWCKPLEGVRAAAGSPETFTSPAAPSHRLTFAGTRFPASPGRNGTRAGRFSPTRNDAGADATSGRPCASTDAGEAVRYTVSSPFANRATKSRKRIVSYFPTPNDSSVPALVSTRTRVSPSGCASKNASVHVSRARAHGVFASPPVRTTGRRFETYCSYNRRGDVSAAGTRSTAWGAPLEGGVHPAYSRIAREASASTRRR